MAEGITEKVIKEFLAEVDEIVENINVDLMAISSTESIEDIDPDLLNSVFRGAHTLKGIAAMLGFQDISHLSHDLETILDSIRLGKLNLTQTVLDVLFEGMEYLTSLIKGIAAGDTGSKKEQVDDFINNLNLKLSGTKESGKETAEMKQFFIDKTILNVLTEYEEHRLEENKKKKKNIFLLHSVLNLETFDDELSKITSEFKPHGEVISILPSSGEAPKGMIEFDILVGTNKVTDDIKKAISEDITIKDLSKEEEAKPEKPKKSKKKQKGEKITPVEVEAPKEAAAEVKPISTRAVAEDSIKSISQTVRVDITRLDSLMNIVGELVLSKAIIGEITEKLKSLEGFTGVTIDLYKANRDLGRKLEKLQGNVMNIRMIPLRQVFEKMSRIVRKMSRTSAKEIDFKISGADTELDKFIVEELGDPLMHSIRNSIDHGIESPEEREQAGKPRRGTITLRASQKGNYVVIDIEDDGKGISKSIVRQKAIEKGLIKESSELREKDIYNLLLIPGFSTKDDVSETSGRGVGMDVVKENISRLSGMIDIISEEGVGTKITLTLPMTLAIIQALIIELAGRLYAISLNSVSEIIKILPEQIQTIEKKEVMELRDETLPLLRLKDMFGLTEKNEKRKKLFVVVIGFGIKKIGVIVDALRGQQDIVIKSIGETFKNSKGIAGATDLGNQKTILVLDVGALIEEALE